MKFSVRDDGIGIPEERMDRLFQVFSQVDPSTTRYYGGTGLGLAICKLLAELMGGRIWVESTLGKGSVFHFTIRAEAVTARQPVLPQTAEPGMEGKQVLILDDNATNREILTGLTRMWGMEPTAAANVDAALTLARSQKFDVALVDWNMPGKHGGDFAREIRASSGLEELPMILLSSGVPFGESSMDLFDSSLGKPVRAMALFQTMACLFGETLPDANATASTPKTNISLDHPLKILLVDDNNVNQRVAALSLQRLGYRADLAANGLEAIAAVTRTSYDVILMDVQMPEMDGLEATRIIRSKKELQQPWVIALTAGVMSDERKRAREAGMDDFMAKPFKADALAECLKRGHLAIQAMRNRD